MDPVKNPIEWQDFIEELTIKVAEFIQTHDPDLRMSTIYGVCLVLLGELKRANFPIDTALKSVDDYIASATANGYDLLILRTPEGVQ